MSDLIGVLVVIGATNVIALPFLILGLVYKRRTKKWTRVEGEIVPFPKQEAFMKKIPKKARRFVTVSNAKPTVRFERIDGGEQVVTAGISHDPPLKIGRNIGVYYNPEQPTKITLEHFAHNGNALLLIAIILYVLSLIPIAIILSS
ncbi:DUF3592 domain-containing protein [Geomicrobium sp. JCM 19038]|uniref:DUF3592 domain-containing protein n=1 Tax=Geomicrobium sp. JCM 19038 TaxID=1460635 RepID=UPI00045F1665|nr:DUF3592 domain-containing protein [Geomicrobium sp. JCM 19038]GAK10340.1 hypothetical protein JCM19038_4245 [Geomicrobium sp. JCM 19038]